MYGAEILWEVEEVGDVEMAGWSGAIGVSWLLGDSSARTMTDASTGRESVFHVRRYRSYWLSVPMRAFSGGLFPDGSRRSIRNGLAPSACSPLVVATDVSEAKLLTSRHKWAKPQEAIRPFSVGSDRRGCQDAIQSQPGGEGLA